MNKIKKISIFAVIISIFALSTFAFGYVLYQNWDSIKDALQSDLETTETISEKSFVLFSDGTSNEFEQNKSISTSEQQNALIATPQNALYLLDSSSEIKVVEGSPTNSKIELVKGRVQVFANANIDNEISLNDKYLMNSQSADISCTYESENNSVICASLNDSSTLAFTQNGVEKFADQTLSIPSEQKVSLSDSVLNELEADANLNVLLSQYEFLNDSWHKSIACVQRELNNTENGFVEENSLIRAISGFDCFENQSNDSASLPDQNVTINNVVLRQSNNNLVCSWSGTNTVRYEVSIGSRSGKNDIVDWFETVESTATINSLVSGTEYFCNVRGISLSDSKSEMRSSNKFYLDNSIGKLTSTDPSPFSIFTGSVGGTGIFTNVAISDLQIRYSILNKETNQFASGGTTYSTERIWFTIELTDKGNNQFSFESQPLFEPNNSAEITIILQNKVTGRVLDTVVLETL